MNTSDKIIEESLKLFSVYGYHAVSVRDIAQEVGIKDSSLYNHYTGKQDIFNHIVMNCFRQARDYFGANAIPFDFDGDFTPYEDLPFERLIEIAESTFLYFIQDAYNIMFRKLLVMSQNADKNAREIYLQLFKEYPLKCMRAVFETLERRGEIKEMGADRLATEFYGVPFMVINTVEDSARAKAEIDAHVRAFLDQYRINK